MRQTTVAHYGNKSSIFNNGRVVISRDLIFGLSVFTDGGYVPLETLDRDVLELVDRLIDFDPLFPWGEELTALLNKK